ncbi:MULTISPECIES: helix-turn-helix domain-containing protein [unclassified Deinococcus]|jgi:DNA-binding HxlR family transcriptional regulator|uniref:winged helix-turn-helix transcriptional regulator n=1 Tax=unclassified Deinococcus TaxID=2623546 RepID=UPI001E496060|nr:MULTISPECIES: helix-turn-helix domain-containing protein [unclassified Deinococcus]MCD0161460.1 helix-turn-helix transcriptional regulator [Deinococcus sp. 6YEL10]MCD0167561.1 helix-turn-helix transcriptional regulator [Deinococcus sp. 12RED42]MCD0169272.1 helix-turn-helix transcriptional regulator [Deinococcus sp. 23YEL01]MCD0177598.1 helix-turn-helix transcriptional regulator [Deinococcus sp. 14RED07]
MQAVKPAAPPPPTGTPRSGCPVSLGLDIFGDRWTLLIVRDLMFSGKRHYREMLASDEHISSNILADRLKTLLGEGIITKTADPTHQQKVIYSLTEKGVALLPVLMAISDWSHAHRPVSDAYLPAPAPAALPPAWEQELEKVRRAHQLTGRP